MKGFLNRIKAPNATQPNTTKIRLSISLSNLILIQKEKAIAKVQT